MNSPMRFPTAFKVLPLTLLLTLCGCSTLENLDKLMALQDYSKNKDLQDKTVLEQNKNFEKLRDVVLKAKIQTYPDQKSIARAFGQPVFVEAVEAKGQKLSKWLYRYSVSGFGHDKIYLYFDSQRKLSHWEYLKPEFKKSEPKDIVEKNS